MSNKCFEYFKGDNFARENGIVLVSCNPGHAIVKVEITSRHLNGAGVVHGGLLFTLADFAFAVASNTHGKISLAINADISFFKAVSSGIMTAEAKEISLHNKLATYLIDIVNEKGELIANFKGTVYRKSETMTFE